MATDTLPDLPTAGDLAPTTLIESQHPDIVAYAESVLSGLPDDTDDADKAAALFLAVRDGLRYDPFAVSYDPEDYRASNVLGGSQKWCVSKAILLAALTRSIGLPTRLGYADVMNHLQSPKLAESMGTDLFAWHGFTVIWIGDKWLKASPAFNKEMCERFGTKVLDFDGRSDALLHAHDESGNRHMEYINDRGTYQEAPLEEIFNTFYEIYPNLGGE